MQLGLVLPQLQRGDLLPQGEVLEDQLVSRLAGSSEQPDQQGQEDHERVPDSARRVAPTGDDRNPQPAAEAYLRVSCILGGQACQVADSQLM